ncbi:MAG: hypothetical protein M0R17_05655 [Candidatus Omnitrophica bacterium]|jgi:ribosomal protein L14E/L6E/L27E|nr:hypothetical protein [Candidatus Omnitrophota bacterium]
MTKKQNCKICGEYSGKSDTCKKCKIDYREEIQKIFEENQGKSKEQIEYENGKPEDYQ